MDEEHTPENIRPWPLLKREVLADFRIFKVRQDHRTSPRTGREHDFFVLETSNWVNVVALTVDHQLILVRQFRHGTETINLETPGGVMDPTDASPLETGARELLEETGFTGDAPILIGEVLPNPAIMNNVAHTVLIQNCRLTEETRFDSGEDIATELLPEAECFEAIRTGKIRHSLCQTALLHYLLWKEHGVPAS